MSLNRFLIAGAVAAAPLLAACGGSSHSSSSSSQASSSAPSSSGSVSATSSALTLSTAKGSTGTYLVGASGRALYLWVADGNGKSSCSGACAKAWPPLTASTMPHVSSGVNAADVSLISRGDGSKQVAYKGHPLYYFIADTGPGMIKGQGSNGFGAKWWLVAPSGNEITIGGSSAGASSSGSSSSSSGSAPGGSSGSGWG